VRTELYFGSQNPGADVTRDQFDRFVGGEVTPRFPDGSSGERERMPRADPASASVGLSASNERLDKAMSTKTRTSATHPARMSSGKRAAWFAYAAGFAGIVANALLIAFYAFQFARPEGGTSLGSANDLVGSLSTAFMIPVALVLSARLPKRRPVRIVCTFCVAAMVVLSVGGPLLVLGTLSFEVQAPIMLAAWMVLSLWLFLVNRWSRLSDSLPPRTARFGEFAGVGPLVGGAIVGAGFLLPSMSWVQLAFFGVGGLFGIIGFLGIPVWFLLFGRRLSVLTARDGREEM
jgi:MFS family permease